MAEKMFYTMGEVAEMFDVRQSLLRHWESQFPELRPKRNKKGNRLFTPQDVERLKMIYHLVKERGMTLDGAKRAMKAKSGGERIGREAELMERLQHIRALLAEVREELKGGAGERWVANAVEETAAVAAEVEGVVSEAAVAEEAAHGEPSRADELSEGAGIAEEDSSSSARRGRRRRKKEGEDKELFAFFEQSLF